MTLVVNLFAGPGAGKSTTAAAVFADLKRQGIETEFAHEYAKDLTWEDRKKALRFQPYVAAKQMWRVHRLLGQVQVVITDSPILFSLVYKGEGHNKGFESFVIETFNGWNNLNFLLKRHIDKVYSEKGRNQTEDEALGLDRQIRILLDVHDIDYLEVDGPPSSHDPIVKKIIERL